LAAAVFVASHEHTAPDVKTVLLFGLLIVFSQHRIVELSKGISVNADFMIMMAAVVAFQDHGPLLGPMLVVACRGPELRHIRSRSWALMACNSASGSLAVLAAALTFGAFNADGGVSPLTIVAALTTSLVCVVVMGITLMPGLVLRGLPFRTLLPSFVPSAIQSLPFCILGFFVGTLYIAVPAVVVLLIVPMVIAREVFASYIAVKAAHDETVQMLIRALEAKDSYTAGHAERVAMYAQYVGEQMHFMPSRMERLRFAALMHDIGKLVVPNHILNKPGKLTEEEFACIKTHERVSVQMLSNIEFLRPIAGAGHSDNTRFDPDDQTHPIEPYIVMIADAYDAMTSTRAYRKALPQEVAFQELRDRSGVQFHPACVEALIVAIENRGEKHGAGYEIDAEFEDAPEVGLGSAGLGDLLPAEA
jgi:hypothetical protein